MSEQFATTAKRWLYTTNHKDIGILYIVTSLFFFVAAGLLALTVRTQLSVPDNTVRIRLCQLYHPASDRRERPRVSEAERDELLVLPVQRRDDDSQLLLRCSPRPGLDLLLATDLFPVRTNHRSESRRWCFDSDCCFHHNELR